VLNSKRSKGLTVKHLFLVVISNALHPFSASSSKTV